MGLWITLRQDRETSFFRQHLLNMISESIKGDCLVLASGYFSEDMEFSPPPQGYSISEDKLAEEIQKNKKIRDIWVIGAKDSSKKFHNFCNYLDIKWGKNVQRFEIEKKNWHAKIAMKLITSPENGEKIPVCAIIGSSNLTRPAYGIASEKPRKEIPNFYNFNHECDVLIFVNDGFIQNDSINSPSPFFPGFEKQAIGSIYFKDIPEGTSELDQLNDLWHKIKEGVLPIRK